MFETLVLHGLNRGTVRLAALRQGQDLPDRHDPRPPLWGTVDADARGVDLTRAPRLLGAIVEWIVSTAGPEAAP